MFDNFYILFQRKNLKYLVKSKMLKYAKKPIKLNVKKNVLRILPLAQLPSRVVVCSLIINISSQGSSGKWRKHVQNEDE